MKDDSKIPLKLESTCRDRSVLALDEFVKFEILDRVSLFIRDWVQKCNLHRMRENLG